MAVPICSSHACSKPLKLAITAKAIPADSNQMFGVIHCDHCGLVYAVLDTSLKDQIVKNTNKIASNTESLEDLQATVIQTLG